jgi:hypothetical protein
MDYSDALRLIRNGGRVARSSWVEPGKYIYWVGQSQTTLPDGSPVELAGHPLFYRPAKGDRGLGLVEPYAPGPDAQSADDWYEVEAPG